jgi:AcrR family transcriptional regulator
MARPRDEETRRRILDVAQRRFAAGGFAGASLRQIGGELGMANSSLLHYFPSKRRLYAGVLRRVASTVDASSKAWAVSGDPEVRLRALHDGLFDCHRSHPEHAQIVMRELVDNAGRAEGAGRWYLEEPIRGMADRLASGQAQGHYREGDALLQLFALIGSISYFFAGLPTLVAIVRQPAERLVERFRVTSWAQTRAALLEI